MKNTQVILNICTLTSAPVYGFIALWGEAASIQN